MWIFMRRSYPHRGGRCTTDAAEVAPRLRRGRRAPPGGTRRHPSTSVGADGPVGADGADGADVGEEGVEPSVGP